MRKIVLLCLIFITFKVNAQVIVTQPYIFQKETQVVPTPVNPNDVVTLRFLNTRSAIIIRIPFTTTSGSPALTLTGFNTTYSPIIGNKPIFAIFDNNTSYIEDKATPPQITYLSNDTTQAISSITWDFPVATSGYILMQGGSGNGGSSSGNAGGDLSGTYPNPTVAKFNHQLPSYYLNYGNLTGAPTNLSSFTNGPGYISNINGITAGGDLSGTYPNPTVAKFNGQLPSYYATYSEILVGRNAANFGLTASQADSYHYNNSGGDNTFTVGAWLNFLSGTGNVIVQVTWTDGHNIPHTKTFYESGDPSGTTYSGTNTSYSFDTRTIRVKDGTVVQVSTTAVGTVDYEVGGFITKIVGDGGL